MQREDSPIHADQLLTKDDVREIELFIAGLRGQHGPHWGFVLDLRDNLAQVLRCIYSDSGSTGFNPVMNIPLIPKLSWRATAIESSQPLFFDAVDMSDPRSFYLRKTVGMKQTVLFPIKADTNIGLLTMFHSREAISPLSKEKIAAIHRSCGALVPVISRGIMKKEQDVLEMAMLALRKKETPIFVAQLFNRLLDLPVLFLENVGASNFRGQCWQGFNGRELCKDTVFQVPFPKEVKIWEVPSGQVSIPVFPATPDPITAIKLGDGNYALLVSGNLSLRGRHKGDFFHFLNLAEQLLDKPPYQLSTLTFLLHLQHWIQSENRDINVVFQYITDHLISFLHADFGTLALLDHQRNIMMFASQAGKLTNPISRLRFNAKGEPDSILSWVARHHQPYLAKDVRKDPYYKSFDASIRSEMCVPIQVRGKTIGLFSVSSRRVNAFSTVDLVKLRFFSDQIGIGLFQAGILDRAFAEDDEIRKLDQQIMFGFDQGTHAKDLTYHFGNLVGQKQGSMRKVFEAIHKINASGRDDLNILITGETGSGKEMIAFALHNSSRRGQKPMVVANFASFGGDPNLIQSELFGHEKGSFSGATNRRVGCIEQANGSTLLIDEVGDIVPSVQIKLLRILQQGAVKSFQRLGGQVDIQSNVRILAATHKDLWKATQSSQFREDLFYRLQTIVLRIPPLRERLEDIPLFLAHFIAKYQRIVPELAIHWTDKAVKELQNYNWPGNVRQLEAVINRALVLYATDGKLTDEAVRESLQDEHQNRSEASLIRQQPTLEEISGAGGDAFWSLVRDPFRDRQLTKEQVRDLIREALQATQGSYKQAAQLMGISPQDYNRFMDFLRNSGTKLDFRSFRHS